MKLLKYSVQIFFRSSNFLLMYFNFFSSFNLIALTGFLSSFGTTAIITANSISDFLSSVIFDCNAATGSPAVISVLLIFPVSTEIGFDSDRHLPMKLSKLPSNPLTGSVVVNNKLYRQSMFG